MNYPIPDSFSLNFDRIPNYYYVPEVEMTHQLPSMNVVSDSHSIGDTFTINGVKCAIIHKFRQMSCCDFCVSLMYEIS